MGKLFRFLLLASMVANLLPRADAFAEWHGYGWGPCSGMMGWGCFGGIMMGIIWIGAIIVIVLLIRRLLASRHVGGSKGEESALDILRKRYARGEINKEEFEEKKKDLG